MSDLAAFGLDQFNSGDFTGDPFTSTAVGVPAAPAYYQLPGDQADAQAMDAWNPAPAAQAGAPWWAGIAAYGITRAIDNQFPGSPTGIQGNTYPGSGAGNSGRTYTMRPNGAGGGVGSASTGVRATASVKNGNLVAELTANPMLLAVLLVGALVLLK